MNRQPTRYRNPLSRAKWRFSCLLLTALAGNRSFAITPGQIDTFESSTVQGWTSGGDTFDSPLPAGGPAGAADHFISVNSGTYGGKSRWVIFNHQQWTGDYLAAGVTSIAMDLLDQDPTTPFSLRLALLPSFPSGSTTSGFVSNTAVVIPADGLWHHAVFNIWPATMTLVFPTDPPASFSDVLSDVSELRLFINAGALPTSVIGDDNTNAKIGLDNITALAAKPVGDFDLNGVRNSADIPAMLTALTDLNHFQTINQLDAAGLLAIGDTNSDGKVDNADLQGLLNLLHAGNGTISAVPEPDGLMLAGLVGPVLLWLAARWRTKPIESAIRPTPGQFLF